jgi:hypothetical protein
MTVETYAYNAAEDALIIRQVYFRNLDGMEIVSGNGYRASTTKTTPNKQTSTLLAVKSMRQKAKKNITTFV